MGHLVSKDDWPETLTQDQVNRLRHEEVRVTKTLTGVRFQDARGASVEYVRSGNEYTRRQ